MEYKHIDNERYPGSPYLTLSRFHGPTSYKSCISTEAEDVLLVFDVSFVEEHEMVISLPEPQLLEVSFKHGFKNTGRLSCRRHCSYAFKFSKKINEENLVAQWTEDDFLIIKEKKPTDIKESDTSCKEISAEPQKKVQDDDQENTILETSSVSLIIDESEDKGDTHLKETKGEFEKEELDVCSKPVPRLIPHKIETSSVSSEIRVDKELADPSSQNRVDKSEDKGDTRLKETKVEFEKEAALDVCSKPKSVPRLIPHKVDKIFKPIICVSELKSVMDDIENKMLFVKNFIDDYSFEACSKRNTDTEIQTKTLQNE